MLNWYYVVAGESLCVLGDGWNPYTRRVMFGRQRTVTAVLFFRTIILSHIKPYTQGRNFSLPLKRQKNFNTSVFIQF